MHLIKIILSSLLLSVFINNVSANEIIVPKETQDVLQIFMIVNPDNDDAMELLSRDEFFSSKNSIIEINACFLTNLSPQYSDDFLADYYHEGLHEWYQMEDMYAAAGMPNIAKNFSTYIEKITKGSDRSLKVNTTCKYNNPENLSNVSNDTDIILLPLLVLVHWDKVGHPLASRLIESEDINIGSFDFDSISSIYSDALAKEQAVLDEIAAFEANLAAEKFSSKYPYTAILGCGPGGTYIATCFINEYGDDSYLNVVNGQDYQNYTVVELQQAGRQTYYGLEIDLRSSFTISAKNSNDYLKLSLKIIDKATGKTIYAKSVPKHGVVGYVKD